MRLEPRPIPLRVLTLATLGALAGVALGVIALSFFSFRYVPFDGVVGFPAFYGFSVTRKLWAYAVLPPMALAGGWAFVRAGVRFGRTITGRVFVGVFALAIAAGLIALAVFRMDEPTRENYQDVLVKSSYAGNGGFGRLVAAVGVAAAWFAWVALSQTSTRGLAGGPSPPHGRVRAFGIWVERGQERALIPLSAAALVGLHLWLTFEAAGAGSLRPAMVAAALTAGFAWAIWRRTGAENKGAPKEEEASTSTSTSKSKSLGWLVEFLAWALLAVYPTVMVLALRMGRSVDAAWTRHFSYAILAALIAVFALATTAIPAFGKRGGDGGGDRGGGGARPPLAFSPFWLLPFSAALLYRGCGLVVGFYDPYHQGEYIFPAYAMAKGLLPYRDIFFVHGIGFNVLPGWVMRNFIPLAPNLDITFIDMISTVGVAVMGALYLKTLGRRWWPMAFVLALTTASAAATKGARFTPLYLVAAALTMRGAARGPRRRAWTALAGAVAFLAAVFALDTGAVAIASAAAWAAIWGWTSAGDEMEREATPEARDADAGMAAASNSSSPKTQREDCGVTVGRLSRADKNVEVGETGESSSITAHQVASSPAQPGAVPSISPRARLSGALAELAWFAAGFAPGCLVAALWLARAGLLRDFFDVHIAYGAIKRHYDNLPFAPAMMYLLSPAVTVVAIAALWTAARNAAAIAANGEKCRSGLRPAVGSKTRSTLDSDLDNADCDSHGDVGLKTRPTLDCDAAASRLAAFLLFFTIANAAMFMRGLDRSDAGHLVYATTLAWPVNAGLAALWSRGRGWAGSMAIAVAFAAMLAAQPLLTPPAFRGESLTTIEPLKMFNWYRQASHLPSAAPREALEATDPFFKFISELKQQVRPGDRILDMSDRPALYPWTETLPPSRFYAVFYAAGIKWQREILADLKRNPPQWVIWPKKDFAYIDSVDLTIRDWILSRWILANSKPLRTFSDGSILLKVGGAGLAPGAQTPPPLGKIPEPHSPDLASIDLGPAAGFWADSVGPAPAGESPELTFSTNLPMDGEYHWALPPAAAEARSIWIEAPLPQGHRLALVFHYDWKPVDLRPLPPGVFDDFHSEEERQTWNQKQLLISMGSRPRPDAARAADRFFVPLSALPDWVRSPHPTGVTIDVDMELSNYRAPMTNKPIPVTLHFSQTEPFSD